MRAFDPALLQLLDEGRVKFAGMMRFDLGEGPFGIIMSSANHTWDGITWKAVPRGLIDVSAFQSAPGMVASGFEIRLAESPDNGITPTEIMNFETYDYADRPVTIYDLFVHPDTGAILTDPVAQLRGYVDKVKHESGDQPHAMTVMCETRGMDLNRTNGRINSEEDQKRISSTDNFFEGAGNIPEIKWGRK